MLALRLRPVSRPGLRAGPAWAVAAALLAPALACAQAQEAVPYTTITRRVTGGPATPVRAVIGSHEAYARFFQTQAAPPVDFANEVLLVVHPGTLGSSGYATQIVSIQKVTGTPEIYTVTFKVGASPDAGQVAPVSPDVPQHTVSVHAEVVKIARPRVASQVRWVEQGSQDRVGFEAVSRVLRGRQQNESVLIDHEGRVKVRAGEGEGKETRLLLCELDRVAAAVRGAELEGLPRTLPSEQWDGTRFRYALYRAGQQVAGVEGFLKGEGEHAARLAPVAEAFDLVLGRLEGRAFEVRGTIERMEEADTVGLRSALGLLYTLRGPVTRILADFAGREVHVQVNARLTSATTAEGSVRQILYPQRQSLAGTVEQGAGGLALRLSPPMPQIPVALGGRGDELCRPELGKPVLLESYVFYDARGIPAEAAVQAIRAITVAPVTLRDRPEQVSMPTGQLGERTSVWVTNRKGGAEGIALVAGQKNGWTASQFLRFTYVPIEQQEATGLSDVIERPDEDTPRR